MKPINSYIDHTLLKSTASIDDITTLCNEAMKYYFFSVCVNGYYVPLAEELLRDSKVKICTVVGFPLGAMSTRAKLFEAEDAIGYGADEVDMVMNLGLLKSGKLNSVETDIASVKNTIGIKVLKVIIETCYLTSEEISTASKIVESAGADYVKTSTGFGPKGASLDLISEIKKNVSSNMKIKASGGIRDFITARAYIDLGVSRIGTSSGIAIFNGEKSLL
ncbi:deoxyribose-phosphate aldolase [Gillisia mitskevichiae]|uniref:Deoxyribose-phosphate aldolase n=1 Tax=Gillisia mitskevichiae TaxID=270921 RepID=A0A495PU51_9FLAO|nr:deoxyribose-phosphate aldolase [Gillisia mitskevichiae]RKS53496.1 deoxyribose-phosphate aldolase [Gillisia mitskevichiae]